jgi:type II secretory pathway component PulM
MTKLLNFLNQRSQREQKLLLVSVVLILCLLVMSFVSNLVSQNATASTKYQNARSDYAYVQAGAMNLWSSTKIAEIKNNQATLELGIQDIARVDGLTVKNIDATATSLSIAFVPDNLSKTKQFLEDISRLSGFAIDTFELQTESGQQLVTAIYKK